MPNKPKPDNRAHTVRVPDPRLRRMSVLVAGEVVIPGFPWKFSAQPELAELVAPRLGELLPQLLRPGVH